MLIYLYVLFFCILAEREQFLRALGPNSLPLPLQLVQQLLLQPGEFSLEVFFTRKYTHTHMHTHTHAPITHTQMHSTHDKRSSNKLADFFV